MVDQSKEDIFYCKGLCDVAMATKFWPKLTKKSEKMAITLVVSDTSMPCTVWFWGWVCAVWEFICDTPVHEGQSGVTMATIVGTKIAMNAYKCISPRDNENVITCGRPIQRRHFWLQGSNARCHGNQFLAKIGKNITKMAITSGLRYRGIYLWLSRTHETKGRYYVTILGLK